jgi:hypothetical protein
MRAETCPGAPLRQRRWLSKSGTPALSSKCTTVHVAAGAALEAADILSVSPMGRAQTVFPA